MNNASARSSYLAYDRRLIVCTASDVASVDWASSPELIRRPSKHASLALRDTAGHTFRLATRGFQSIFAVNSLAIAPSRYLVASGALEPQNNYSGTPRDKGGRHAPLPVVKDQCHSRLFTRRFDQCRACHHRHHHQQQKPCFIPDIWSVARHATL